MRRIWNAASTTSTLVWRVLTQMTCTAIGVMRSLRGDSMGSGCEFLAKAESDALKPSYGCKMLTGDEAGPVLSMDSFFRCY
ncbi:unnamed protein product [Strongylus vulgaris]|uniref:Secreted protein n=1 Tax=Strongylus vulgaris TaxID=40348 RepID=A0A3P7JJS8_STRVU|nr:unnamed protein product [Strongylus vulgaris]